MNEIEFKSSCHKVTERWLNWIHGGHKKGLLKFVNPHTYATQLRIAESPTHFLAELVGVQQVSSCERVTLSTRAVEKLTSSNSFFLSGKEANADGAALVTGDGHLTILGGVYSTNVDKNVVESRLNLKLPDGGVNCTSADYLIDAENLRTCYFNDANFIYSNGPRVYFRYILWGIAIPKDSMGNMEFIKWLEGKFNSTFSENKGVGGVLFNEETSEERVAKQLISLSEQKITERILDKFLQEHKDVLAKALSYQEVYPQCILEWVERESSDPEKSIPDYFMKREGGTFDILDVKKGFLDRKITKGQPARIRFIDYVTELIAQLETYKRYFSSKKNRKYAEDTYGIKVCSDEIKLLGIVGGYYEHDFVEVEKALAPYKDHITIIGYADLANLIRLLNR